MEMGSELVLQLLFLRYDLDREYRRGQASGWEDFADAIIERSRRGVMLAETVASALGGAPGEPPSRRPASD